jgi:hypothetical protein
VRKAQQPYDLDSYSMRVYDASFNIAGDIHRVEPSERRQTLEQWAGRHLARARQLQRQLQRVAALIDDPPRQHAEHDWQLALHDASMRALEVLEAGGDPAQPPQRLGDPRS